MNRIVLSTITFMACGLQALPTQQEIVEQLKQSITATDVASFEAAFNTHTISSQEKQDLGQLARVTRVKLQTEVDAMGRYIGNGPTFLMGLAQGSVGLWALLNITLTGTAALSTPYDDTYNQTLAAPGFPGALLIPSSRTVFCFTQGNKSPEANTNGRMVRLRFEPHLDQQLGRLWAGCALTGIPLGALAIYMLYKAGTNLSRGLNYKKYLNTKIANLDIIIQYLA